MLTQMILGVISMTVGLEKRFNEFKNKRGINC